MTEAPLAVASAVIVPDAEDIPSPTLKRRQSSISENGDSKRRRVSYDGEASKQESVNRPEDRNERLGGKTAEERKRGRRLFGALLGTLSQSSSSSTAHKRRTDIEQKQQAKLKQQTEEADERKKERLETLMKARRKEQRVYDRQSLKIRHSNLHAQAHFLRTKTEPRLFYKPWKLDSNDEDTIQGQIAQAEETAQQEMEQWEVNNPPIKEEPEDVVEHGEVEKEKEDKMDTVGDDADKPKPPGSEHLPATTNDDRDGHLNTNQSKKAEATDSAHHHGEEMVEGEEDTVIY